MPNQSYLFKEIYAPIFMDGAQLSQDYRATKWGAYFLPLSHSEFLGVDLGVS